MSDLIVKVVRIDAIESHPNADRLCIVKIGGWQIVSGLGNYKVGDLVVHVPPECLVPKEWADKWSVTPYLSWKSNATKGRVKAVKLRQAASYGFLAPNESGAEIDTNVADFYGIEKYEEPEPLDFGQAARQHPYFHKYTDIANLRNFPKSLKYDEPVWVTEKLHGTNSRVGWVRSLDENGTPYLEKVIGTHRTQRKLENAGVYGLPFELYGDGLEKAKNLIETGMGGQPDSIIFFGEIFGPGVQDLQYDLKGKDWRLFDIAVNGTYFSYFNLKSICEVCNIPLVPHYVPYTYNFEKLCELAEGKSALAEGQIKEGIVVRPLFELTWGKGELDPNPKRMIFKLINSDYLCRKGGTEKH